MNTDFPDIHGDDPGVVAFREAAEAADIEAEITTQTGYAMGLFFEALFEQVGEDGLDRATLLAALRAPDFELTNVPLFPTVLSRAGIPPIPQISAVVNTTTFVAEVGPDGLEIVSDRIDVAPVLEALAAAAG